jgi:hypothetical protein
MPTTLGSTPAALSVSMKPESEASGVLIAKG